MFRPFWALPMPQNIFLSGEGDKESLQKALTEFDNVKKLDSNYRLDSRYFSPRILELFAQESEKTSSVRGIAH